MDNFEISSANEVIEFIECQSAQYFIVKYFELFTNFKYWGWTRYQEKCVIVTHTDWNKQELLWILMWLYYFYYHIIPSKTTRKLRKFCTCDIEVWGFSKVIEANLLLKSKHLKISTSSVQYAHSICTKNIIKIKMV